MQGEKEMPISWGQEMEVRRASLSETEGGPQEWRRRDPGSRGRRI